MLSHQPSFSSDFFFLILTPCLKSAELRSFQSLLFLYYESSTFSLGVHTKTVHVLYISYNTIIMFHKDLLWSFSCMLGPTRVVQWKCSLGNWIFFFLLNGFAIVPLSHAHTTSVLCSINQHQRQLSWNCDVTYYVSYSLICFMMIQFKAHIGFYNDV